ncbi:hypothetical protein [uncultured Campylobacter sp.]|uniref:hypothetical protein n=1 Tax=uncultured Campylobacter sp. TaxID=218934 RepID=UPI00260A1971|nr:hypothetical protein [uncultured Campylobacter sp.]
MKIPLRTRRVDILEPANSKILVIEKFRKISKFKILSHARFKNIYSIQSKISRYDRILKFYA